MCYLVTCIFPATDAISPFYFSFPAIYNYNASQDVELSLQIGDTVHILEMYEGKSGWPSARRGGRENSGTDLLIRPSEQTLACFTYFLKGCWENPGSTQVVQSHTEGDFRTAS